MKENSRIRALLIIMVMFSLFSSDLKSQVNSGNIVIDDSLSLKDVINQVIKNHPSIKSAEEAINNANARIGLAKTGFYPNVDATVNYSNMGPVLKFTIPSSGTFQLNAENNYSAAINYQLVVCDFGRTKQNIEMEKENKAIGEQTLEQVKQKMALIAVNNFYTLDFLQAAIKIKDEQLGTLQEHLSYVEKMLSTGSATEYQVLTTKVKISSVESQKLDLVAALSAQQSFLNSLLGQDENKAPFVKNELQVSAPVIADDSLISYAFRNRDEILLNEKKTLAAGLKYDLVKSQNKPFISLQASGGAKNGYVPYLNQVRANYIVGLGIRIPIYDGMKTKYNLLQAGSSLNSLAFENEFAKRNITNEIRESEAYMSAAEKKIGQFELQLEQALKAYSLAQTSFKSGVITNLDLLDANTAVSESRLMLLKARIDYAASVYSLFAALGERIY